MVIILQILTQKKSIQNTASDYDFFNLLGQFNPFSIKFDNKKKEKKEKKWNKADIITSSKCNLFSS